MENSLKHGQNGSCISVNYSYENKTILFTNSTDNSTFKLGIGVDTCKELAMQIWIGVDFEISEGEFRVRLRL